MSYTNALLIIFNKFKNCLVYFANYRRKSLFLPQSFGTSQTEGLLHDKNSMTDSLIDLLYIKPKGKLDFLILVHVSCRLDSVI